MQFLGRGALVALMIAGILVWVPHVQAEEWSESFTVSEDHLRLANLIGEIQVEGHRGPDFEIEVHVRGDDADRDLIRIEQKEGRNASLAVRFPVDREKRYVYPPMGRSDASFSLQNASRSWWKELLGFVSGDKIKVSGRGRGLEVWADIVVRVPSGARLLVEHGVGEMLARGVDGDLSLGSRWGKVEVTGVDGELSVDTGSGSVRVVDVEGALSVDTGSGSVTIEKASGDKVLADTGSGGVELQDISCRALVVDTGSGGIVAGGVRTGSASLDTGSGSVTLILDRMNDGDIEIDTGSGSIDLRLPRSASATVHASTGSGGIQVDLDDVRMIEASRNEKRFRIGDGDARIHLDTGSGSIRVSE